MSRRVQKVAFVVSLTLASVAIGAPVRAEPIARESTPVPLVSGFSPGGGTKGVIVTITGTNLGATQQVRFYSVPAVIRSTTDTTVTFVVPDLTPATYPISIVSGDVVISKPGFVVPTAATTGLELAVSMKTAGARAVETATVLLRRSLVSGGGQGIDALNRAGYSANEQALAAKDVFGKSPTGTAILLKGVGHPAPTIVSALRMIFGASAQDAAAACSSAGITVETTAAALASVFSATPVQTAAALRSGAWTSISGAGALAFTFKLSARDVALSLKNASYTEKEVYDALVTTFSLTRRQALDVMLSAGYSPMALLGSV